MHTLHARRHVTKTGAKLWWTCDLMKCRVCCWFAVVHTVLCCCCRTRREGQRKASFLFSSLFAYLCVTVGWLSLSLFLTICESISLSLSLPELTPAGWVPVILTNKSWQLLAGANINAPLPGRPTCESVSIKQYTQGFLFTDHRQAD